MITEDAMTVWRICKEQYLDSAFEGIGAKKVGGRWNNRGISVVYTSESLALATLELLVHVHADELPADLIAISAQVPTHLIARPFQDAEATLPEDWRNVSGNPELKAFGDRWQKSSESVAIIVPSVVIPLESNLVLNPEHPDFGSVKIGAPQPFSLDSRLLA